MTNEGREGTENLIVGQEKEKNGIGDHFEANKKITILIYNSRPRKKENRARWPAIFISMIIVLGMLAIMPVQAASPATPVPDAGPAPVNLGTAGDFVILAQSGITATVGTHITGDIGVYPIASGAITGFGLIDDASGEFATSTLVTGKVYAADYADPTPTKMLTAIGDKDIAYADAAGRAVDYNELYAGDITGQTLTPGCYKWTSVVLVSAGGVTIHGAPDDVWIFQTSQGLTVSSGAIVTLSGGAKASNIFWQVAGQVTLGTTSQFKGIILCDTQVVIQTGATLDGRALAKTAVTLDANNITVPPSVQASKSWTLYNGRNYKTFTSNLTVGWKASDLAEDVITNINANYSESLSNMDLMITKYDSALLLLTTCYWSSGSGTWFNDFSLISGDNYIVEILNNALSIQPRLYEQPNFALSTSAPINIYNGCNFRGFALSLPGWNATDLALDIKAKINTTYGESLENSDIRITMYDSVSGSFTTCFYFGILNMWFNDFVLSAESGYIIEILNGKLDTSPRGYQSIGRDVSPMAIYPPGVVPTTPIVTACPTPMNLETISDNVILANITVSTTENNQIPEVNGVSPTAAIVIIENDLNLLGGFSASDLVIENVCDTGYVASTCAKTIPTVISIDAKSTDPTGWS
jgi:hypothetical protein